jgi:hypothetical protein
VKADETTTRVDTATATTELMEKRDAAPLFDAAEPAEAVLADSEMSVGVAPSARNEICGIKYWQNTC